MYSVAVYCSGGNARYVQYCTMDAVITVLPDRTLVRKYMAACNLVISTMEFYKIITLNTNRIHKMEQNRFYLLPKELFKINIWAIL